MNFKYLIAKFFKKIQIPAIRNSEINKTSKICSSSHIVNTIIDRYSYVGNYSTLVNTKLGSFCSIADNCIIGGSSHPIQWVSTSPVFHEGENIMNKNFSFHEYKTEKQTIIGHDVWIGSNCLIKSGIEIKNGAIIGMGSVVTKNVGEYEIWAGNPAKLIRKRFEEDTIKNLQNIKWWLMDEETLSKKTINFNDVKKFISEEDNK